MDKPCFYPYLLAGLFFAHITGVSSVKEKSEKSKMDMMIGLSVGFTSLTIIIVAICIFFKCCCTVKQVQTKRPDNMYYSKGTDRVESIHM